MVIKKAGVLKKSLKSVPILLTICVIFFSSVVYSVGDSCYQISDSDSKNYCLATAKVDKNYCYQISDNDRKNQCLALTRKDKNYCYQIKSSNEKNQCLGQF
jgi:hypothetical protein